MTKYKQPTVKMIKEFAQEQRNDCARKMISDHAEKMPVSIYSSGILCAYDEILNYINEGWKE